MDLLALTTGSYAPVRRRNDNGKMFVTLVPKDVMSGTVQNYGVPTQSYIPSKSTTFYDTFNGRDARLYSNKVMVGTTNNDISGFKLAILYNPQKVVKGLPDNEGKLDPNGKPYKQISMTSYMLVDEKDLPKLVIKAPDFEKGSGSNNLSEFKIGDSWSFSGDNRNTYGEQLGVIKIKDVAELPKSVQEELVGRDYSDLYAVPVTAKITGIQSNTYQRRQSNVGGAPENYIPGGK